MENMGSPKMTKELEFAIKDMTKNDQNILTIIEILKNNRSVGLEKLILNRTSFAQTTENLTALSYMVKEGRVEITVDKNGCHLVSLRNTSTANAIDSGEFSNSHCIFRFDFKNWKSMIDFVDVEEELVPNRMSTYISNNFKSESDSSFRHDQVALHTTPVVMNLSRNRGLVTQEHNIMSESPKNDDTTTMDAIEYKKE